MLLRGIGARLRQRLLGGFEKTLLRAVTRWLPTDVLTTEVLRRDKLLGIDDARKMAEHITASWRAGEEIMRGDPDRPVPLEQIPENPFQPELGASGNRFEAEADIAIYDLSGNFVGFRRGRFEGSGNETNGEVKQALADDAMASWWKSPDLDLSMDRDDIQVMVEDILYSQRRF
jgi:hypothetical protein